MAEAKEIRIRFTGDQPLDPSGAVWINSERHGSIYGGESPGVDVTAMVEVEGLKDGEFVKIWWCVEWKKDGQKDQNKANDIHAVIPYVKGLSTPTGQVTYRGKLVKADSGWQAVLRVRYSTNSETAKIVRRSFRGWRLEA